MTGVQTCALPISAFDEVYDANGDTQANPQGAVSAMVLGTAIEYGVTDQITAAVQWAPGYVFSSSIENDPVPGAQAHAKGLADLFIGAKFLIVGENGYVKNDNIRVAFAPGMMIPLEDPDYAAELARALGGEDYKVASPSLQAVGLGFRAYFDWVLSKMFYINLYNQSIFYLPVTKDAFGAPEAEYEYGYSLTFEVEPHFNYALSDKVNIGIGVPVNYNMKPEVVVNGTGLGNESYILTINPGASVFVMAGLPFEIKGSYSMPLAGKNSNVASALAFQVKAFLKF